MESSSSEPSMGSTGLEYATDSFIYFLFSGFDVTFTTLTFLGEVLFPLWLAIKGMNVKGWEQCAFESTQAVAG